MSEAATAPRKRRLWLYALSLVLLGLLALAGAAWYLTTDSFQSMMLRRSVAELERITGGRVELASLHTIPFRLQAEMRGLTIHGSEAAGEVPLIHVESLTARIKVISLLETQFGFQSLVLEKPVVHIIVYPDGSTNQPEMHLAHSGETPVEQLFSLSIENLQVRRGELILADQKIPLDFTTHDVSADMTYSFLRRRYETNLLLGKVDTMLDGYRPVAWTAEAHFFLSFNSVEVKSLKMTSGRSRLEARGKINDFRQPRIEGDYDLTLDLAESASVARNRDLRGGTVHATGHGAWSTQDFSSAGQLALKDLEWRHLPAALHAASLNTRFTVDSKRLTLSQAQARVFGGSITGDADVTGSMDSLIPKKNSKANNRNEAGGNAKVQFKDLRAEEIAGFFSTIERPFHRVNLAAAASGTMDAHWRGPVRNAEVTFSLDVVPPAHTSPDQLPVTARVRGSYRGPANELQVSEFTAATRATQVRASGTLSSTASVKLSVTTSDLGEWQPILAASGYQGPIPITLHGDASFSGTATGRISDIAFTGNLQSKGFDLLVPATGQAPERLLHWDSLDTDLRLSSRTFAARNGRLQRTGAAIDFDFRLGLEQRKFTESSPFRFALELEGADLAEVLALAGYNYPVSGTVNLHFQAQGTRAEPVGQGHIQLTNAVLYGEPIRSFESDLVLTPQEAKLGNLHLAYYEGEVNGETAYDLSNHSYRFQFAGNNFSLARIPQLQKTRVSVEGLMDFTASGSGTLDQPSLQAAVRVRDLTLDHERTGNLTLNAVSQGGKLHLEGQSQFEHAALRIEGDVNLRDQWPADFTLHLDHLDVDSFLRTYLRGHVTGHSAVSGDLRAQGPLRRPRKLEITGHLGGFLAEVDGVKVHNEGPVLFSISQQVLKIGQFHLLGDQTDFSGSGTVQLTGPRPLDLQARGQVNLKLIQSLNPDFTSSGVLTMDMNVSGTAANPTAQGRVKIENGNIAYLDLPSALSDINGSLVFTQDRLQVENLVAHMGGGSVRLTGYAASSQGQLSFNFGVHGQDVRLRYPPGVSSTANVDLSFAGTRASSTLSGEITVTRFGMTPGFDFAGYLQRSAQAASLPTTNPMLNSIRLDIHVVSASELQMQTASMRLSADADLRVHGTGAKPVVSPGRIDILEGWVYFNGTKYQFERGEITFTNSVSTEPNLDLQASTRIHDYDITLNVSGSITKPNVTYRSEPPLPPGDIIGLLAFGQTTEESAQLQQSNQSAFSQAASSALINAALNATVSNRVQRIFGVSRIKVDPQGLVTETSPTQTGPALTIEQQVNNNLTITYTTDVAQSSQQIIQAEYNLTRNVSIVGLRDVNGVVSFDVRVRQRKK
ncbi:MAG TPA: translocation/assembly module TamB domain-containing protein [Terriglobales bacterium]|nr:translocation/assembly module TamB domain-containing protein [Terriglobales bacterium]